MPVGEKVTLGHFLHRYWDVSVHILLGRYCITLLCSFIKF